MTDSRGRIFGIRTRRKVVDRDQSEADIDARPLFERKRTNNGHEKGRKQQCEVIRVFYTK